MAEKRLKAEQGKRVPARRARATTSPMTRPRASTSREVEVWPREKRSEPRARAVVGAHGQQHVAGLGDARRCTPTRWSRRYRSRRAACSSASPSQPGKEKCALPGSQGGVPAAARFGAAAGDNSQHLGDQVIAQPGQPGGLVRPLLGAYRGGHRERPDGGGVHPTRAAGPLLTAAVRRRHRPRAPRARIRAPTPSGHAELVRGDGERIRPAGREVHRQLRGRLRGNGVKRHTVLVGDRGELADRLHRADFVVGPSSR